MVRQKTANLKTAVLTSVNGPTDTGQRGRLEEKSRQLGKTKAGRSTGQRVAWRSRCLKPRTEEKLF